MDLKNKKIIIVLTVVIIVLIILCFLLRRTVMSYEKYEAFNSADEAIQSITTLIEKNFIFSAGMIVMWSGTADKIPAGWSLCNGTNGTPNLSGRFIVASGGNYTAGQAGGTDTQTISIGVNNMPPHSHPFGYNDWYYSESDCGNGWLGSGDSDRDNGPCGNDRRGNTDNAGGGQPISFDNRPAFYALAFIMKLP